MEREIIITADGSKTIQIKEWGEQYHSLHGAIQEAYHVFIKNGLSLYKDRTLSILEIGFGTGLNSLITLLESPKLNLDIDYTGVEKYPVTNEEVGSLDYILALNAEMRARDFTRMHQSEWGVDIPIAPNFQLRKELKDFKELNYMEIFDLIYFDAFGARVQPELWTEQIFSKMVKALKKGGVLVTYAANGGARRAMQAVGFTVERLPGPTGKREMLRGRKI